MSPAGFELVITVARLLALRWHIISKLWYVFWIFKNGDRDQLRCLYRLSGRYSTGLKTENVNLQKQIVQKYNLNMVTGGDRTLDLLNPRHLLTTRLPLHNVYFELKFLLRRHFQLVYPHSWSMPSALQDTYLKKENANLENKIFKIRKLKKYSLVGLEPMTSCSKGTCYTTRPPLHTLEYEHGFSFFVGIFDNFLRTR